VLVARTAPCFMTLLTLAKISRLTCSFSVAASITRSASASDS